MFDEFKNSVYPFNFQLGSVQHIFLLLMHFDKLRVFVFTEGALGKYFYSGIRTGKALLLFILGSRHKRNIREKLVG